MKTVLLLLVSFSFALGDPVPLSSQTRAQIIANIKGLQTILKVTQANNDELKIANDHLATSLREAWDGLDKAETAAQEAQRTIDVLKLDLHKAEKRLAEWQKFGRVMLICISGITFVFLWQALGNFLPMTAGPYAWLFRTVISLGGGVAVAAAMWKFIVSAL